MVRLWSRNSSRRVRRDCRLRLVRAEYPCDPRDYVAAMLRRDLRLEPNPEEIDRLTASLLAAGAFAPDCGAAEVEQARETAGP